MAAVIERENGGIVSLQLNNPPVNALSVSKGIVESLRAALQRAAARSDVEAIIVNSAIGAFSAGADINDFERAPARIDELRQLFDEIAASSKPVIAAIDGDCFGGGLELAIAAHYRVASPKARFAFPEITLGLLPGGGGTQRAPRLIGASAALDLMLDGKPISADRAEQIGLIDSLVNSDPEAAAIDRFGRGDFKVPRPVEASQVPADLEVGVESHVNGAVSEAGRAIVSCVAQIGRGSLRDGLDFEASAFAKLLNSSESKALRHGFFGRRLASRVPGIETGQVASAPIKRVTVVGGGLMGTGIAIALLNANLEVALVEPRHDAAAKARTIVDETILRDAKRGRITSEVAQRRIASLRVASSIADARDGQLFIEAVFEDMAVKRAVFTELDAMAPADALLASNTSTLDLDTIAGFTKRPEQVIGLHFFSPANIMRLLEIVRGRETSTLAVQRALAFAKAINKSGVVAGVCDGFIGNRVFEEYLRQAWFLLEEGALPAQVDAALEAFGMAMGPCRVMDLAGQDIGWQIRKRRAVEQPDRPYSKVPDLICERGRFGQKVGAGFYLYRDGRTAEVDPEIDDLIVEASAKIGLERRHISDAEIVDRCILAMVNEGARIVEEGIAYRPVDIDVVYLDGYGFPVKRGGPMFHADQYGLSAVVARMDQFSRGNQGWAWEPAPLLVELAGRGAAFAELNQ